MGADVSMGEHWIEATAGADARRRGKLRAVELDCNHIPDAAMTLAVAALFADGATTLRNIASWRVKETDRLAAMATELRKLGASEHPLVIVFYFPLIALPAAMPALIPSAVMPSGVEWLWLLLLGVFTQIGQVAITRGLATDNAARMAAYSYVQVLFAGIWGALLFDELPSLLSLLGAALILGGALFNLRAARSRLAVPARPATAGAGGERRDHHI